MGERSGLLSRLIGRSENEMVERPTYKFSQEVARLLKKRGYQTFLLGNHTTEDLQQWGWGTKAKRSLRKSISGKLPCAIEVSIRPGEIIKESFGGELGQLHQIRAINGSDRTLSEAIPGARVIMGDARTYFHLDKEYEQIKGRPLFRRQFVRTSTDTGRKFRGEMTDMLLGSDDLVIVGRRKRSGPLEVESWPKSHSIFYQPGYDYGADLIFDLDGRNFPKYPINIFTVPLIVPSDYVDSPQYSTPLPGRLSERLAISV